MEKIKETSKTEFKRGELKKEYFFKAIQYNDNLVKYKSREKIRINTKNTRFCYLRL